MFAAQRSMQYTGYAWNRQKHITGACDIIEERHGIVFTTQEKRAGHTAGVTNMVPVGTRSPAGLFWQ